MQLKDMTIYNMPVVKMNISHMKVHVILASCVFMNNPFAIDYSKKVFKMIDDNKEIWVKSYKSEKLNKAEFDVYTSLAELEVSQ